MDFFLLNMAYVFIDADQQPYLEEQNCRHWCYWGRRCTQLWFQVEQIFLYFKANQIDYNDPRLVSFRF